MSKTIDERVVSMQLDNKNFEANANASMKTIDKLEQKLNFKGLAKGADTLSAAVKKVDVSPLSRGIQEVHNNFSALEVMGVTALTRITNAAIDTGKRMISALTIDPIKTGFQEYETQMNAVQTILANTQSKGSTLEDVNSALDTLNTYADKTIYNFTEMTRNIGTFTAAGVDLQTSVDSIQGIANLAAVSGSSSQQASTAMYQLSQALAAGKVSLMDWNSVVNAGMGGELFQNALIRTSELLKTGAKDAIAAHGSFRESLTQGEWLTTEVLTETLKQLSGAYTEADLIAQGFTKEQAAEITKLAETATDAATKVKTFSQLWDVMKESAQSGWSQTWKLIVGDFEEAKSLLTPLADFFTGAIGKMSDARNRMLGIALDFKNMWSSITDKLNGAGVGKIKEVVKSVGDLSDKLEYYQDVVTRVWRGDYNNWGDNPDRRDLLAADGYDHRIVQDLVNKGYQYKITVEDIEASYKKFGVTVEKSNEKTKETSAALSELTDKQLKAAGLTADEIELYRALAKEADRMGISIEELADKMSKTNGRTLLIDSFKNFGDVILGTAKAVKEAFVDIFNPPGIAEMGVRLYGIISAINEFSKSIRLTDPETGKLNENGQKLQRTFKGLFAALDIILTVVGGPLKIAFKIITSILSAFDLNILDVTAAVGDVLVKFHDWIDATLDWKKIFEKVVSALKTGKDRLFEWFEGLKETDDISGYIFDSLINGVKNLGSTIGGTVSSVFKTVVDKIEGALGIDFSSVFAKVLPFFEKVKNKISELLDIDFGDIGDGVKNWFAGLKGAENIPKYIIDGLVNGLQNGITIVGNAIVELGKIILSKIKEVLGIHSPSTEFFEIGQNIITGLLNGLKGGAVAVWNFIKGIGTKCIEIIKNIDFGALFAAGISVGMTVGLFKIGKALEAFSSPLEGLGDVLEGAGKVLNSFSGTLKSISLNIKAQAIKSIAVAIAILAASVIALSFVDPGKLWGAIGALAAIAVIIGALTVVMTELDSIGGAGEGKGVAQLAGLLLAFSVALLLIAGAIKLLGSIDPDKATVAFGGFAGIIVALIAVIALYGTLVKGKAAMNIGKVGGTLLLMSVAIMLMVRIIKQISKLDEASLKKGIICIGLFGGLMVALIWATQLAGKNAGKVGSTLLLMSAAMMMLVLVVKSMAKMSYDDINKGLQCILGFAGIIALLTMITSFAGKDAAKIGGSLLAMSAAMLIMTAVVKMLAGMDPADMGKGLLCVTVFGLIIAGLIAVTRVAGGDLKGLAGSILAMSISIGILAGVCALLSLLKPESLVKGTLAVAALALIMAGLIAVTHFAKQCKGELIVLTVAIAVLATAVAALSFIDPTKLTGATVCLGVLIGMFALLVSVAGTVKGAMGTLVTMTVAVAVMGTILILLANLPVENTLGAAIALSLLMATMAGVMMIVSAVAAPSASALGGLIVMGLVVAEIALILGLMAKFNVAPSIETAAALSTLLIAMSAAMVLLAVVGLGGPAAFVGIGALATLIAGIGGLIVGIGYLMTEFPKLEEFLNKGIPILGQIGTALGTFFGNIVGGFVEGAASSLPVLGTCLSQFMINATPFVNGVKMVDSSVLAGIGILTASVIALTAADLIAGIGAFLSGGTSFATLGMELSMFMMNAMPFVMGARMIDPAIMTGVKTLAEAILILSGANLIEGLTRIFGGESSLATFGSQLGGLGANLRTFVDKLGVFDEATVTTVNCAGQAIKALATAANEIPNEGGWIAKLLGENSLAAFGTQLPGLASNLRLFVDNLGTFDDTTVATVDCAGRAIKALATAANEIPNEGGWIAKILGENSLATFGSKLPQLGTDLKNFITNLGTFGEDNITTVDCAGRAIKALAEAANKIPNEGGWISKLVGDNSLATFGSKLPQLATDISGFVSNLGTFGEDGIKTVNSACKALTSFAKLGEIDLKSLNSKLGDFGDKIISFAKKFGKFSANMGEVSSDSIASAKKKVEDIIALAKSVAGADGEAVLKFADAMKDLGKKGISKFVEAVTGGEASDKVKDAAKKLVEKFIKAAKDKKKDAKSGFETLAKEAAKGLTTKTVKSAFKQAGKDLVTGFADGIDAQTFEAEAAATAMAEAALAAAKEALDSNSPSKEFYKLGTWGGMGFVNAFGDYENEADKAGGSLANASMKGLSRTISNISTILDSGLDINPTIKPLLDLTNIRSGANAIGNMLTGRTLAVDTQFAYSTAASMADIQNGGNDDIVSAIAALRKDIANMPRNVYSINGITVEEGSDVADAIELITRKARMERRA